MSQETAKGWWVQALAVQGKETELKPSDNPGPSKDDPLSEGAEEGNEDTCTSQPGLECEGGYVWGHLESKLRSGVGPHTTHSS